MNIEDITGVCTALPSVTQDIKWEDHLCFNIGDKMFFITSLSNIPTTASFKASPEDFDALIELEGFKPAPYMARYKWVHCDDINRFTPSQWKEYIGKSFDLIASKLSKKLQKELDIRQ